MASEKVPYEQRAVDELNKAIQDGVAVFLGPNAYVDLRGQIHVCNGVQPRNYAPLHMAVKFERVDVLEQLLRVKNVSVNIRDHLGRTPLHLALEMAHEYKMNKEIVDRLCACPELDLNACDEQGWTTLHYAARCGAETIVAQMAYASSDAVNAKTVDENDTPLHLAARYNQCAVVRQLLCFHGLEVNAVEQEEGFTPLHVAVANGNDDVVKLLLSSDDVVLDIKDHYCGKTPLELAVAVFENRSDLPTASPSKMKKMGRIVEMLKLAQSKRAHNAATTNASAQCPHCQRTINFNLSKP